MSIQGKRKSCFYQKDWFFRCKGFSERLMLPFFFSVCFHWYFVTCDGAPSTNVFTIIWSNSQPTLRLTLQYIIDGLPKVMQLVLEPAIRIYWQSSIGSESIWFFSQSSSESESESESKSESGSKSESKSKSSFNGPVTTTSPLNSFSDESTQ